MNPELEPTQKTEEKLEIKKENRPIKALRTFAGDVEEALSKNKSSSATIMIAEQKRREERPELTPPTKLSVEIKNKTFFLSGITLVILSLVVFGAVYYYINLDPVTAVNIESKSLISSSKEKTLELTGTKEQFIAKIISEKTAFSMSVNSVLNLRIVDSSKIDIDTENFLKFIGKRIPSDLSRSFDKKYMIGIYSFDTNEPFIILKTSDYGTSYAGMLKWEKEMSKDLGELFSVSSSLYGTTFVDEEYKNKDLRVLRDAEGKVAMLYSFIDKNTLLITANENVFSAILGKYVISQQVR